MNATMEPPAQQAPNAFHQQPSIPGLVAMPPKMWELAEKENWNYWRLCIGCHEEMVRPREREMADDGEGNMIPSSMWKCLRLKPGDVFRSPLNLLAHNRGSEKFQLLHGMGQFQPGNNPNQLVWDMTRETLEQFNERVKRLLASGVQSVGVSATMPQQPMPRPNMPEAIGPQGLPPIPPGQQLPTPASTLPPYAQVDFAEYDERKLREIAAEREVDISKCRSKTDLVGTLRKALNGNGGKGK